MADPDAATRAARGGMPDPMIPILAAFQFLTIFPEVIRRPFTAQEMGRAAGWFPLVGLALGGLLAGIRMAAGQVFPPLAAAALTLLAWVALTRAFHLDGFMDACDGLFGGFTPQRRLEIMKDSRVGAFGVAGAVLVLLLQFSALASVSAPPALILAAVLGRWVSPLVIHAFPYARPEGLGSDMKRSVGRREVLLASLIAAAACWLLAGWTGLGLMAGAALLGLALAAYAMRLLPGLTGDLYGAVTTTVETGVLLFFTVSL